MTLSSGTRMQHYEVFTEDAKQAVSAAEKLTE